MQNADVDFTADSGHGGRTRDLDGDEVDGYDEGDVIRHYFSVVRLRRGDSHLPSRLSARGNYYRRCDYLPPPTPCDMYRWLILPP